jgi:hypothetical protein
MSAASLDDELMLARATAALLDIGAYVAVMGALLTALAVVALLRPPAFPAWTVVALLGVADAWYALRVRLDAGLFRELGAAPIAPEDTMERRLARLDAALATLRLQRTHAGTARSLAQRVAGARRLLVRQVLVAATQLVLALFLASYAAR